jgi:succinate dehydrogenase/fumarate reductase flavoprotein subunit
VHSYILNYAIKRNNEMIQEDIDELYRLQETINESVQIEKLYEAMKFDALVKRIEVLEGKDD